MGLRDLARRLTTSVEDIHDERLQDRFAGLDVTPIEALQPRIPTRIAGEVSRMRLTPRSGVPALEIVVDDGTGEAVAVFTGRRSIPGIEHGRAVIIEGVPRDQRGRAVFLNPAYTLI